MHDTLTLSLLTLTCSYRRDIVHGTPLCPVLLFFLDNCWYTVLLYGSGAILSCRYKPNILFKINCQRQGHGWCCRTSCQDTKGRNPRLWRRMCNTGRISVKKCQESKAPNIKNVGNCCRWIRPSLIQRVHGRWNVKWNCKTKSPKEQRTGRYQCCHGVNPRHVGQLRQRTNSCCSH